MACLLSVDNVVLDIPCLYHVDGCVQCVCFAYDDPNEGIRYAKNIGLDMVLLNAFAYSIELILLILSLIVMTTYLVVSHVNRRFHYILRVLMGFMCFGMLLAASFRIYIIPIRLILGRGYENSWIQSIDIFCNAAEQLFIFQLDTAIFLISVERLVATVYIKHYEYMFRTAGHKIVLVALIVFLDCICSHYLFSDAGLYSGSSDTLMYFSGIATTTRITGFILLRLTQRISRRHLNGHDRTLSKSYQCHENMQVVKLISPVYILLFITQFCQFAFRIYGELVRFMLGAFALRFMAHLYNLSLALSVFLTPALLIAHQPNLAAKFMKKKPRTTHVHPIDANATTTTYFDELKKMWT